MFYRCKEFKLKDASGADIDVKPAEGANNPDNEVIASVNELRNSITIYPNVNVGASPTLVTVNRTPCYIVSGGSLEITEGQAYKTDWITFTDNAYPIIAEGGS